MIFQFFMYILNNQKHFVHQFFFNWITERNWIIFGLFLFYLFLLLLIFILLIFLNFLFIFLIFLFIFINFLFIFLFIDIIGMLSLGSDIRNNTQTNEFRTIMPLIFYICVILQVHWILLFDCTLQCRCIKEQNHHLLPQ